MPCLGPYGFEEMKKRDQYPISTDNLEILLCSACRSLEERGFDFETNPALSIFWDKHKKKDQARLEIEAKEKLERAMCLDLCNKSPALLTREDKKLLRKYKLI